MFGSHFKQVSRGVLFCVFFCDDGEKSHQHRIQSNWWLFEMSFGLKVSIEWLYRTSYSQFTLLNSKMTHPRVEFWRSSKRRGNPEYAHFGIGKISAIILQ